MLDQVVKLDLELERAKATEDRLRNDCDETRHTAEQMQTDVLIGVPLLQIPPAWATDIRGEKMVEMKVMDHQRQIQQDILTEEAGAVSHLDLLRTQVTTML